MAGLLQMIPGLPNELAVECLTRIHPSALQASACVCRAWRRLLGSPKFYRLREQQGHAHLVAVLIQSIIGPRPKLDSQPPFGITFFNVECKTWERVDSVPWYMDGLPLYCQVAISKRKLVIMGGWDPVSYDPVSHVSVYDLMTRQWTKGKDMPAKRTLFAVGGLNGRVIVAGGHDPYKNASKLVWAYDVLGDEWSELTQMSQERDECQGVVIGPELWVVSGYSTECQGKFESSADVYNVETSQWRRMDDVWMENQNPRSNVVVGPMGELTKLTISSQPWACSIDLREQILVYKGEVPEFLLINKRNLSNGGGDCDGAQKLEVPDDFLGFVQTGCYVKI